MATLPVDLDILKEPLQDDTPEQTEGQHGWGARRAKLHKKEKLAMAEYFVEHDLLIRKGTTPAESRDTVASILANQGSTPNVVVQQSLDWLKTHWKGGPFDVTWYTTSGLVNASLHEFRERNPGRAIAAQVFLLPGRVNTDLQAVSGPEAEKFVEDLKVALTYAFLSVHAFDLDSGRVQFQYSEEVRLQRACASLYADHKFLFIDASKFRREGTEGYGLEELLEKARTVTIYTTTSAEDAEILERFNALCDRLLPETAPGSPGFMVSTESPDKIPVDANRSRRRTLRLRIVDSGTSLRGSTDRDGFLPLQPKY